jgi:hypothetical protein
MTLNPRKNKGIRKMQASRPLKVITVSVKGGRIQATSHNFKAKNIKVTNPLDNVHFVTETGDGFEMGDSTSQVEEMDIFPQELSTNIKGTRTGKSQVSSSLNA